MSNIYIQEPPTHGKVCLETTVGDIEIELWSRECPTTCRNFVQLCLENYYNKTKFHRVVKDFIVQGGDPTGTGNGGESAFGEPFKDEFHSRLRFVRRGLVAMANSGKDDNGSQFFFTLGPTQELQNKHTIFGKVIGDTIYNMLKLQEGVLDGERPVHPYKINKAVVLINPFPDVVPRQLIEMISDGANDDRKEGRKAKSKMKATKDFKLLSFGAEAEEEETGLDQVNRTLSKTSKSSHDLLSDPKLLKEVGDEIRPKSMDENDSDEVEPSVSLPPTTSTEASLESIRAKLSKSASASKKVAKWRTPDDYLPEPSKQQAIESKREALRVEIRSLKRELKSEAAAKKSSSEESKRRKESEDDAAAAAAADIDDECDGNDLLKSYREEKKKYCSAQSKVAKKGSAREEATMALLNKFKAKLSSLSELDDNQAEKEDDDEEGDTWLQHTLVFEASDPVLAKDANRKDDEWFDIYDPRNPLNKRRRERDRKRK